MTIPNKPLPQPTELSRPYWEAAAEGRLIVQHCAVCDKPRHYPRLLCDTCYADTVVWKPASGAGRVHSWTVAHHAFHPAFAVDLPYTLVTVDLDAGVRALGLWRGVTPTIGQSVQGRFLLEAEAPELLFEPITD